MLSKPNFIRDKEGLEPGSRHEDAAMLDNIRLGVSRNSQGAVAVRDKFAEYFMSP